VVGARLPVSRRRARYRATVLTDTPKVAAACSWVMPRSTAATTRSRRSIEYARMPSAVPIKQSAHRCEKPMPTRIWNRVGRRPLLAAGNSNGDRPMLDFTRHADRPFLRLLVLHDDAVRELAYTAGAEKALEQAERDGWTVVSMKNDWAAVF